MEWSILTSRTALWVALMLGVNGLLSVPPALASDVVTFVVDTADDPAPDPVLDNGCDAFDDNNPCSLREAVMAANANGNGTVRDLIVFDDALPAPTVILLSRAIGASDTELTGDLDIHQSVEIDGDNRITISAEGMKTGQVNDSDRVLHIQDAEASEDDYLITRLAITGGFPNHEQVNGLIAPGPAEGWPTQQASAALASPAGLNDGGGVLAEVDYLELDDVYIHDNVSPAAGGGLAWFGDGELALQRVTIENNLAFKGGGAYVEDGLRAGTPGLSVLDSSIAHNAVTVLSQPTGARGSNGAAAASLSSGSSLEGGGLLAYDASVIVENSAFLHNGTTLRDVSILPGVSVAGSPAWRGGGLLIQGFAGFTHRISDSLFMGNRAGASGGGIALADAGDLLVDGTTFDENRIDPAGGGGGGALHFGSADTGGVLRNVTLSGNEGGAGAAIHYDYHSISEAREGAAGGAVPTAHAEVAPSRATTAFVQSVDLVHVTVTDNVSELANRESVSGDAQEEHSTGDLHLASSGAIPPGGGFTFFNSILQSDDGTPSPACFSEAGGEVEHDGLTSYDGNSNPDRSCFDEGDARPGDSFAEQQLGDLGPNGSTIRTGDATMGPRYADVVPTRALRPGAEAIDRAADRRDDGDDGTREPTVVCGPLQDVEEAGARPVGALTIAFSFGVPDDQRDFPRPAGPACDRGAYERAPDPEPGPGGPAGSPQTVAPDITIDKTGPPSARVGDELAYTLTVTNRGTTATQVAVTDPLPTGMAFISASEGCAEESGTITCAAGSLADGQQAVFTITAEAAGAGTLTNTACVTHAVADGSPEDDCDDHDVRVREETRLSGSTRVETAIAASQATFPDGAAAVVLARSDLFPDAQTGTPLAVALRAPLLLSTPDALHEATEQELLRLLEPGATVYLLGGVAALGEQVEQRIAALGLRPVRLSGPNRFATAVAIARFLDSPPTVLAADGIAFHASVLAGAAATRGEALPTVGGRGVGAVLLTAGETVPVETRDYLDAHPTTEVIAIGDPAAAAFPTVSAVPGQDPAQLSVDVATRFFPAPAMAGLATVADFADALVGGAVVNLQSNGPMLFTEPADLPDVVASYLGAQESILSVIVFGGPAAIALEVEDEVTAILAGR